MTLGGTVTVVTAALVVAGATSCLSVLNTNFGAQNARGEGELVIYKTEFRLRIEVKQMGDCRDGVRGIG